MLAKIHSILARVSTIHMIIYRPTYPIPVQCWASIAAHFWFNAEKLFTTLTQHYSNTGSAVYLAAARAMRVTLSPPVARKKHYQCNAIQFVYYTDKYKIQQQQLI